MNILCPTDFSVHSRIALEYAVNLCNQLDAQLHIINTYSVRRNAASMIDLHDTIKKNTEEDMQQLAERVKPLVKTEKSVITGVFLGSKASDMIKAYSEHNDIDLIVMGTQGSNSLKTLLFGSTTARLSQVTSVPILAIPNEIEDRALSNRILLTLDQQGISDASILDIPKKIAESHGIYIDILHVSDGKSAFDTTMAVRYLGSLTGETVVIEDDVSSGAIKRYAEENDVGLIVMARREKSFFQRLLSKGNTAQEVLETFTPLMILPDTEVDDVA